METTDMQQLSSSLMWWDVLDQVVVTTVMLTVALTLDLVI